MTDPTLACLFSDPPHPTRWHFKITHLDSFCDSINPGIMKLQLLLSADCTPPELASLVLKTPEAITVGPAIYFCVFPAAEDGQEGSGTEGAAQFYVGAVKD